MVAGLLGLNSCHVANLVVQGFKFFTGNVQIHCQEMEDTTVKVIMSTIQSAIWVIVLLMVDGLSGHHIHAAEAVERGKKEELENVHNLNLKMVAKIVLECQ